MKRAYLKNTKSNEHKARVPLDLQELIKYVQVKVVQKIITNLLLFLSIGLILITFSADAQKLTIISPNGGESWAAGTVHSISWTDPTAPTYPATIRYSTDNGVTWNSVCGACATPMSWTVPNTPSTQCLIEVLGAGTIDTSDAVFTITASTTAIQDNLLSVDVTITPNPTVDFLTISMNSPGAINSIKLYNMLGEKVQEISNENSGSQQLKINVSHLVHGVYIVNMKIGEALLCKRIVIGSN